MLFSFAFTLFFSETGEAFLEEYPNNKRDQKTLEELILISKVYYCSDYLMLW